MLASVGVIVSTRVFKRLFSGTVRVVSERTGALFWTNFNQLKVQSRMTDLSNLIQDWAKDFPRRLTPTYNQRYQFQIRHCGNEEIRVRDGGDLEGTQTALRTTPRLR